MGKPHGTKSVQMWGSEQWSFYFSSEIHALSTQVSSWIIMQENRAIIKLKTADLLQTSSQRTQHGSIFAWQGANVAGNSLIGGSWNMCNIMVTGTDMVQYFR